VIRDCDTRVTSHFHDCPEGVRVKGCALLQGSRRSGDVSGQTRRVCMGEGHMSSVWVRNESGGVEMLGGKPHLPGG
jgi:hypothetical protein